MDLATGRRNRVPVAQLIRRTLRDIEPHARELGCERELEGDPRDPRQRQRRRPPAAGSSTRTATSSRSSARSPTRPRSRRSSRRLSPCCSPATRFPDVRVWVPTQEGVSLRDMAAEKPVLLLFYLFDWSST